MSPFNSFMSFDTGTGTFKMSHLICSVANLIKKGRSLSLDFEPIQNALMMSPLANLNLSCSKDLKDLQSSSRCSVVGLNNYLVLNCKTKQVNTAPSTSAASLGLPSDNCIALLGYYGQIV